MSQMYQGTFVAEPTAWLSWALVTALLQVVSVFLALHIFLYVWSVIK